MAPEFKSREMGRYLLVGGCAVLIDFCGYYALSGPLGVDPSWAKRISFTAGAAWAFFANKFFTFKQPLLKWNEPLAFIAVYGVGFLANSAVHDFTLRLLARKLPAVIAATAVSTIWNFIGQKFLVFRRPMPSREHEL